MPFCAAFHNVEDCCAIACGPAESITPQSLRKHKKVSVSFELCIILVFDIDIYIKEAAYITNHVMWFGILI